MRNILNIFINEQILTDGTLTESESSRYQLLISRIENQKICIMQIVYIYLNEKKMRIVLENVLLLRKGMKTSLCLTYNVT